MVRSSFFFSSMIIRFSCSFLSDYFWASVIHFIRKHYIYISWKEGGEQMKGFGYGALSCSFILRSRTSVGERQGEQQFCNIITIFLLCHDITARWKVGGVWVCVYFQRASSESREWGGKSKRRREGVVCQTLQRGLSVERDELCLRAAGHCLRGLLLLLLLWTTRGSHLTRKQLKVCEDGNNLNEI